MKEIVVVTALLISIALIGFVVIKMFEVFTINRGHKAYSQWYENEMEEDKKICH